MDPEHRSFHFPVRIDGARGQLRQEKNHEAYVAQLIRQVLLTSPGERAHRPDFGAGLRRMVFSPNDEATAGLLRTTVHQALETWLGSLIRVDEIETEANEARLLVTVHYTIRTRGESQILNLEVTL